jgi:hypothetical protein
VDLDAARTELRERGFDYLSDSRCNHFLNTALTEIEDAFPWPWLEDTATGTAPLTITDLKQPLYVVDTDGQRELLSIPYRDLVIDDPTLAATGEPSYWSLDGLDTVVVYPTRSVSLTVRYIKTSPVLQDAADEPLIPERYHGVWVDRAVVEALKDSDNHDAANTLLADVGRRVEQMCSVFADRVSSYQRVRFMSEDW